MTQKPNLSFQSLFNLSFGFFGVQIAYALQSANVSRIFATLGADPHSLSYFWVLPPLMGMIVQPIVGTLSDRTWCSMGRRLPYLLVGAVVAVAVMCLLPNAGSLGLDATAVVFMSFTASMLFGLIMLMLLGISRLMVRFLRGQKGAGDTSEIRGTAGHHRHPRYGRAFRRGQDDRIQSA